MSELLIKLAVLVVGGLIFGAVKRASESPAASPPPLPTPRAPHRPRRRAVPEVPGVQKAAPASVASPAPVRAASVSPRRQVRFHFSGPADLRRAFVASEVLGRPASLREPHV